MSSIRRRAATSRSPLNSIFPGPGNSRSASPSARAPERGVEPVSKPGRAYHEQRKAFIHQWEVATNGRRSLESASGDQGLLFQSSYNILLTHEDKLYQGAFVASLTIPWGEARDDKSGKGGYHLVWTRDMVESAVGLLAAGDTSGPTRAVIYLAARQKEDGSFPQNFRVNGQAFWDGLQLDEVAFPILLAWRR
jgi:glucoamylase